MKTTADETPTPRRRGRPPKIKAYDSAASPPKPKEAPKVKIPEILSIASNQPLGDWNGRELCICFPCYKETNYVTAAVLVSLALDYGRERIRFEFCGGDAMIYNTRNKLAHQFMQTGSEWSLWLDSDMIPPIGRAAFIQTHVGSDAETIDEDLLNRHFAQRLMGHNQKLIGACYFGRRSVAPPMFNEGMRDHEAINAARRYNDEVRETHWVGTGCLLIHRDVFLDIQKKFPALGPNADSQFWNYFLPEKNMGEDVAFCKRAKEAGHQPFVDFGIPVLHVGYCAYGAHNTKQPELNV